MATAEIHLTEQEAQALRDLAQRTGKTPDALLHEAVAQLLSQARHEDRLALLRQARGIWKDRTDLPQLATLRAEFERRWTEEPNDG